MTEVAVPAMGGAVPQRRFGQRHPLVVYSLKRIAAIPVVLALLSIATFSLTYLTPGDPVQTLLGGKPSTPEAIAKLRAEYHLDGSLFDQYGGWLSAAVHFDFGRSIRTGQQVRDVLGDTLPITVFLGVYAFALAFVIGVLGGLLAARFARRNLDRLIVSFTVVGVSTPAFAAAVVLLYIFALRLGWLPSFGTGKGFTDRAWHLTLPAIALAFGSIGTTVRFTRSSIIDVLEQDYVTFAKARGLSAGRTYLRYVLRNAAAPIITASGLVVIGLLTSTILVETTFATPGVGQLFAIAVQYKDTPVLQALTLVVGLLIIVTNLGSDVISLVLNPRQRRGGGGAV
jgi:peptide/nickel transport system permease protein